MQIEFRNHPAQARHPVLNTPLFDNEGKPIPLIKDQWAIYLEGVMVGYCKDDGSWLSTTVHLQPPVLSLIEEAMVSTFGTSPKQVTQVPSPSALQELQESQPSEEPEEEHDPQ